jgi:protein-disulfide isomerase
MFLNSNLGGKPSLVKPIVIVVAILLVVGGVYTFFGKKAEEPTANKENAQQLEIKSSGIDRDKKIETVGDVEEVLAKWVEANPQAILNSVANMQRKMMEDQMKDAQKNIGAKKSELFNDKNSPTYSPKGYNISIIEFFDYNCGYCKKTNPVIEALIKADPKVRIIYKEFPILGQASEDLSTVALAVNIVDPSSYKKFHDALMNSSAASKEDALKIAKNLGLDVSKIEGTLKSHKEKISAMINANRTLGSTIGVNGTPGFIIGEELIPGALALEALQQKISEQRKK